MRWLQFVGWSNGLYRTNMLMYAHLLWLKVQSGAKDVKTVALPPFCSDSLMYVLSVGLYALIGVNIH
jgi:hypothetical protein